MNGPTDTDQLRLVSEQALADLVERGDGAKASALLDLISRSDPEFGHQLMNSYFPQICALPVAPEGV